MKVEHTVNFPEILENTTGKVVVKVDGYENYSDKDFNVYLAISILEETQTVSDNILADYIKQKSDYLYNKVILPVQIIYKGELADLYTELYLEGQKIMKDPDYKVNLRSLFNKLSFGEESDQNLPLADVQRRQHLDVLKSQHEVSNKIKSELGIRLKTLGWNRLKNGCFDTSIPATLVLQPFEYDENEFKNLERMANRIIKSFAFKKHESDKDGQYYVFTIEYKINEDVDTSF